METTILDEIELMDVSHYLNTLLNWVYFNYLNASKYIVKSIQQIFIEMCFIELKIIIKIRYNVRGFNF